jgi:hypothetical protein
VIAYRFPPQSGAGSLRISKFVRYLPEFGWQPEVLTVSNPLGEDRDTSLLDGLSADVIVHRVKGHYWRRLESRILGRRRQSNAAGDVSSDGDSRSAASVVGRASLSRRFGRLYRKMRDGIEFPDAHVGWVPRAALASARLCRERSIDAIFCSTPPHSAQLAAYWGARRSGVPLVVDLRDPWSDLVYLAHRPWRRGVVRRLERLVFRQARAVILNTQAMREMVRAHYPEIPDARFHAIPNGYDSADFGGLERATPPSNGEKIVLHVGAVYDGLGDPTEVVRGLETVVARNPSLGERVRLRFIGAGPILKSGPYAKMLRESPLAGRIDVVDYQPHWVCVEAMTNAAVLFLVQNSPLTPTQVSSKLYEYLYARRPVLAVTTSVATREVVESTRCGMAVAPGQLERVADALEAFLTDESPSSGRLSETVRTFERRDLTRRLAGVLDEAVSAAPSTTSGAVDASAVRNLD